MGSLFGGGSSTPSYDVTTTSTPAPVQYTDEDQATARSNATARARKAAGALGTIKTSGPGLTPSANVSKKTLLGQ